jgi:TRAP-type C4-dicarboxylate transport system permease small subunit
MLTDRLRGVALKAVLLLKDVITLGILVVLIYYGCVVVLKQLDMGIVSVALKIPMYVVYSSMPVGCFCMAARLVFRRVRGASAPDDDTQNRATSE